MNVVTSPRTAPVSTLLRLGRVSNLPTVWTNVLAATVIAGGDPSSGRTVLVLMAMSLFYIGGMYLNDAFDRGIDARERPTRPIPAGDISAAAVFAVGFGLIGAAILLMALCGPAALVAALALGATIIGYDLFHKGNPLSPLVMGSCRLLVYVGAGAAVGSVSGAIWLAGAALAAHVVGLSYAAKQESLNRVDRLWPLAVLAVAPAIGVLGVITSWPTALFWAALVAADWVAVDRLRRRLAPEAVPSAVAALIAAICLLDALLVAPVSLATAFLCAAAYPMTRLAQRVVPGT